MLKKKWLHATEIGGFNNFINHSLEYITEEVASCHRNRGIQYFNKSQCRIY
jgi:hypothetical protein